MDQGRDIESQRGISDEQGYEIAVVGIGCCYPGANDTRQLWENVLGRRREFRRFPDSRMPTSEYYDPDRDAPDKLYVDRAAFIDGFVFDWVSRRIPRSTYESTDIAQWLALEVADQALADAGYDRDTVPKERTGVIVGNSLTGEQSRASAMRLRWPYVKKVLEKAGQAMRVPETQMTKLASLMETVYKSAFAPVTEDTLQGGLSNTIAGRVCNHFDFHGGGYVVDGACSSSLLAVCTAASYLATGDLDIALAGGVDVSLDPFELVGFAKTGALAANEAGDINVYDRKGAGFLPGEGCGFVVLKRLADARAAGDEVYAVLRGWGISSDGKGGITAPSRDGQALALQRAYQRARCRPHELDFIEGHGTGTAVGDRIELEGIARAIGSSGDVEQRSCGVTSFKSIVGHTKAAAGIGAFIKTVIAVNRRVLPPTAGYDTPNPVLETVANTLFPVKYGKVYDQGKKVRAGVSAMGFGGINSHVMLESADGPSAKFAPGLDEKALLTNAQDCEVIAFGADSTSGLIQELSTLAVQAGNLSVGDLTDLAARQAERCPRRATARAAIVASTPAELEEKLNMLIDRLSGTTGRDSETSELNQEGIWWGAGNDAPRIGFLFPGQGSQQLAMARVLVERYPWAQDMVELADRLAEEILGKSISPLLYASLDKLVSEKERRERARELVDTTVAQPAIALASLIYMRYLGKLGIRPHAVAGHSLGELTAFQAAGAFTEEELLRLTMVRGRAMAGSSVSQGAMASLACNKRQAESIIGSVTAGYVTIANINAPDQIVISGEQVAVDQAIALCDQAGLGYVRLQVSGAFHSQLMEKAASQLRDQADIPDQLGALTCRLLSGVDGADIQQGQGLKAHFSKQLVSQVNFTALIENAAQECDLFLEVGPGRVLSGLVARNVGSTHAICLPTASDPDSSRDLNMALAQAYVRGAEVRWVTLFDRRLVRPYIPASQRVFIENPCERLSSGVGDLPADDEPFDGDHSGLVDAGLSRTLGLEEEVFRAYMKERSHFIGQIIRADLGAGTTLAVAKEVAWSTKEGILTDGGCGCSETPCPSSPAQTEAQPESDRDDGQNNGPAQMLIALVSRRTGFPPESIAMDARLLDDLNLDSIKAGEIIAEAARNVGMTGQVDPATLANASLDTIVEVLSAGGAASAGEAVSESDPCRSAQQISVAVTPAAEPASNIDQLTRMLVGMIVNATGFPEETITPEARLLDDLNLDSIKAGELVASAAMETGLAGKLDPVILANASVATIVTALHEAMGEDGDRESTKQETTSTPPEAAQINMSAGNAPSLEDVGGTLLEIITERTGYPRESLSMDLRLLDDLNLDSIKAGEFVSQAAAKLGVPGMVDPASLANARLNEIAQALEMARKRGVQPAGPEAREDRSDDAVAVTADEKPQSSSRVTVQDDGQDGTVRQASDIASADNDVSMGTWVREFAIHTIPESLIRSEVFPGWSNCHLLVIGSPAHEPVTRKIQQHFERVGAKTVCIDYDELISGKVTPPSGITHMLGILPIHPSVHDGELTQIANTVDRLAAIINTVATTGVDNLLLAQFSGGRFGQQPGETVGVETSGTVGFGSTLWLERPDMSVRIVDLSPKLGSEVIPELLQNELEAESRFSIAGYDGSRRRYGVRTQTLQPAGYIKRKRQWTSNDVVLVTGGAKGITAECALALAKQTGARFALVGSSRVEDELERESEILRNLERFRNAGVQHNYYSCDITDPDAVASLVERVRRDLGAITAVVHGAGVNRPRPAMQVSADEALREVAPKLMGAVNLFRALKYDPPGIVLAMSSIIGITGMRGNAWYAFSNEALDLALRRFAARCPGTSVISLAYSVWGEVGMGHRLGVIKNLKQVGVGAIPTQEGVRRFLHHMNTDSGYQQVVIAGRLGGLPTWRMMRRQLGSLEDMRFVETLEDIEPGVEMIAGCVLNLARDLYLKDHNFHGSYLFPTVFGLEAMTQTACALTGCDPSNLAGFEDVSLERPIVVGEGRGTSIRMYATASELNESGVQKVKVSIRTEQTGFKKDHFSGTVLLGRPVVGPVRFPESMDIRMNLDYKRELYGKVLFQGALFQRLESVYSLANDRVVFSGESRETLFDGENGFAVGEGGSLIAGDPFFRDVLLQSVQLPLVPEVVLPVSIGKIEIYSDTHYENGHRFATAELKAREGTDYNWDIVVTNDAGRVVEALRDYRVRILHGYTVSSGELDGEKISRSHAEMIRNAIQADLDEWVEDAPVVRLCYAPQLHSMVKQERHETERPLIISTAHAWVVNLKQVSHAVELTWESNGKPRIVGEGLEGVDLSLSHDDEFCLCVVGKKPQGSDIEQITARTEAEWTAMLSDARTPLLVELKLLGDDQNVAGTRVWCAVEAAKKAFSGSDVRLDVCMGHDGVVVFTATAGGDTVAVITGVYSCEDRQSRIVAIALDGDSLMLTDDKQIIKAGASVDQDIFYLEDHASRMTRDPVLDQEIFEYVFQPTFKESANLSRTVIYTSYLAWIGKVRELFMAEIGSKLVAQIATGEWGLVTNWADVKIFSEASAYDRVVARFRLGKLEGSVIPLHCEFYKLMEHGKRILLARVDQETTWVEVIGHGLVRPVEFPSYFSDFLRRTQQSSMFNALSGRDPGQFVEDNRAAVYIGTGPASSLPFLHSIRHSCTLEDANLVGNVYYANYFIWQGRVRDQFLFMHAPEYFRGVGDEGEMICTHSRLDYLRDAMPFDELSISLHLKSLSGQGVELVFEYHRLLPDGVREKLAVGTQKAVWAATGPDGKSVVTVLPKKIKAAFEHHIPLRAMESTARVRSPG